MAKLDDVVLAVCRIPLDFYAIGGLSPVELVQRSGYPAVRSEVTVERLAKCLREHSDWVDPWFGWSADNRGTPAWYVQESGSGTYELGFYEGPSSEPPVTFTDKLLACAEFVRREIEQTADVGGRIAAHGSGDR